ncbi:MAG: 16S rRNA (cytosine(1402)-N(4))-methyltransferase RsmH [Amaricoccus sp.]
MMLAPFARHVPVLLGPVLRAVEPVAGTWIDGTFGAGGYSRGLLDAGAARVIGIDRDPSALAAARGWAEAYGRRLELVEGRFGALDRIAAEAGAPEVDGVVLDIGVSSMQLDQPERGFSFGKEGPLDMRMEAKGPSAADLVNRLPEAALADVLYQYGEERAARRIARAIVADRKSRPFATTLDLSELIERLMPRPKPGQPHAATRSFQALRIAVNDELGELARGLAAAEAALAPGGWLAVVTFHSLEDRVVKRFLQLRSGGAPRASRHVPEASAGVPGFALASRKAIVADAAEVAANPRARSAKLRVARRLDAPAQPLDAAALGLPPLALEALG